MLALRATAHTAAPTVPQAESHVNTQSATPPVSSHATQPPDAPATPTPFLLAPSFFRQSSLRPASRQPVFFFFNDTATTEIYTLSLHDALPISPSSWPRTTPCSTPVVA